METKELEYFITIADLRNLSKAANVLYVSQPALSKFISKLEAKENVIFFERIGNNYELTSAGRTYYNRAKEILDLEIKLNNELSKHRNKGVDTLKVGIPSLRANACLDTLLSSFKGEYPDTDIEVMVKDTNTLETALLVGDIDLMFTLKNHELPNLTYEKISKEHICVIVGKDSYLNKIGKEKGGLNLKDIINEDIILQSEKQSTSSKMMKLFKKHKLNPNIKETNNLIASAIIASNGYGVSFLTDGLIKLYSLNKENAYPLLDDTDVYFTCVHRNSYLPSKQAKYFINVFKKMLSAN